MMENDRAAIRIRDANLSDKEAIERVMLDAYEQYATILPADRWRAYRESIQGSVDGDRPIARIVAETDGGELVGSVQLYVGSADAYGRPELGIDAPIIRLLSVSPKARGQGIATRLIAESIRRCLAFHAPVLHLHTSDMMQSAVKLYERLGFERATATDIYNGDTLVKGYRLALHEAVLPELSRRAGLEAGSRERQPIDPVFSRTDAGGAR